MPVTSITEELHHWKTNDSRVDPDRRLVRNIALTGTESRNGYRYTEEALRNAVPLYEGKPVFLDHTRRPHDRSARDLVGTVTKVRYEAERIRADIRVLDTEAGRTFLALAESDSPSAGMSHVVLARRSADGTEVEKIEDVVSIDAVIFPATAASFREQDHSDLVRGSFEHLLAELEAALPDELASREEFSSATVLQTATFPEEVRIQMQQEHSEEPEWRALAYQWTDGELRFEPKPPSEPDAHSDPATSAEIESLLLRSGLPAHAISEAFREQLLHIDPDRRRAWVAERTELVRRSAQLRVISHERTAESPANNIDRQLIEAIRFRPGSVIHQS